MKKEIKLFIHFFTLSFTALAAQNAHTPNASDSLTQVNLNEVIVSSTRVSDNEPIAFSNLNTQSIKQNNTGKNIPLILQTLPSTVAYTEDGSGVGNTSMRIRGTDATRINVTLNGMPLNNPESQEVYWVNLPDISNSLQSIQVQRGVGASTNGAASFGASISLKTEGGKPDAYGMASNSVGSYNTFVSSIAAGTGLLSNGLSLDAKYSYIRGDGYIRNGKVNHKSLYTALSYYKGNQLIRLSYINGIQHTGITWEGISAEQMKEDRKYNPAGKYYDDAGNVHYYDNETDNYYSDIAQLIYSNIINNSWIINAGLSYNHGYGYYENYKADQNLQKTYHLAPQLVNDSLYSKSDVIRRKEMSNNFYTANASLNYITDKLNIIGGIFLSTFDGDHFGRVKWVKHNQNISDNYEWYRNSSSKKDFNIFTRASYFVNNNLSFFADLQYRYISYNMKGIDDDFENITNNNHFNFFNPKLGFSYNLPKSNEIYASLSVANREPLRTDIKESIKGGNVQKIKPERMFDYELGYRFKGERVSFNSNLYYMHYKDQMIQTGRMNDVGYKLMENVPNSYRLGLELMAAYRLTDWFRVDANLTISQNKIKNYTAYYDLYDNANNWNFIKQTSEYLGTTDIGFSPNLAGSAVLTFTPYKTLSFSIISKYVGKQYYDNTSNDQNQLADYFVTNIVAGYSFKTKNLGNIDLQLFVNNILNKRYVANAWVATDKFQDGDIAVYRGFYPQATRNFMVKAAISF